MTKSPGFSANPLRSPMSPAAAGIGARTRTSANKAIPASTVHRVFMRAASSRVGQTRSDPHVGWHKPGILSHADARGPAPQQKHIASSSSGSAIILPCPHYEIEPETGAPRAVLPRGLERPPETREQLREPAGLRDQKARRRVQVNSGHGDVAKSGAPKLRGQVPRPERAFEPVLVSAPEQAFQREVGLVPEVEFVRDGRQDRRAGPRDALHLRDDPEHVVVVEMLQHARVPHEVERTVPERERADVGAYREETVPLVLVELPSGREAASGPVDTPDLKSALGQRERIVRRTAPHVERPGAAWRLLAEEQFAVWRDRKLLGPRSGDAIAPD